MWTWIISNVSLLSCEYLPAEKNSQYVAEIAHEVIDLFVQVGQSPSSGVPSANTSPSTPSSPPRYPPHSSQPHSQHQLSIHNPTSLPYKSDQLMRLKIAMRDREAERSPRPPLKALRPGCYLTGMLTNPNGPCEVPSGDPPLNEGLGRNEGTVRFLFG